MLLSIDTDDILYTVLTASEELKAAISGGIYNTDRPEGSDREDITINTISVNGEFPQGGTSNVNIHVPDKPLKIKGQEQTKIDRETLRAITRLVVSVLEAAAVEGLTFWVSNVTTIAEPAIKQHYANLRITWNIQKKTNN
jgi:hypothetical protein